MATAAHIHARVSEGSAWPRAGRAGPGLGELARVWSARVGRVGAHTHNHSLSHTHHALASRRRQCLCTPTHTTAARTKDRGIDIQLTAGQAGYESVVDPSLD